MTSLNLTTRHSLNAGSSRAEWPTADTVTTATERGWRPLPFLQYAIKLHSRWNLALRLLLRL